MKLVLPMLALLTAALAACADRGADDSAGATAPAVEPPALDEPATDVPPAPAPQPPPVADANAGPLPAPGAISFAGFGPAAFGADAEAVRQAWGGELDGLPQPGSACYYLSPPIEPGSSYALAFMIENGEFARIDVAREGVTAPGGGEIGMSAAQVESLYPDVQRQNHKYVEGGQYLRVEDPAGGDGVLVFETEADGVVDEWRIGVPPQVDYVEGCS